MPAMRAKSNTAGSTAACLHTAEARRRAEGEEPSPVKRMRTPSPSLRGTARGKAPVARGWRGRGSHSLLPAQSPRRGLPGDTHGEGDPAHT